jgi:hypothetical protein
MSRDDYYASAFGIAFSALQRSGPMLYFDAQLS